MANNTRVARRSTSEATRFRSPFIVTESFDASITLLVALWEADGISRRHMCCKSLPWKYVWWRCECGGRSKIEDRGEPKSALCDPLSMKWLGCVKLKVISVVVELSRQVRVRSTVETRFPGPWMTCSAPLLEFQPFLFPQLSQLPCREKEWYILVRILHMP